jgi:hypothetical protein
VIRAPRPRFSLHARSGSVAGTDRDDVAQAVRRKQVGGSIPPRIVPPIRRGIRADLGFVRFTAVKSTATRSLGVCLDRDSWGLYVHKTGQPAGFRVLRIGKVPFGFRLVSSRTPFLSKENHDVCEIIKGGEGKKLYVNLD